MRRGEAIKQAIQVEGGASRMVTSVQVSKQENPSFHSSVEISEGASLEPSMVRIKDATEDTLYARG